MSKMEASQLVYQAIIKGSVSSLEKKFQKFSKVLKTSRITPAQTLTNSETGQSKVFTFLQQLWNQLHNTCNYSLGLVSLRACCQQTST